LIGQQFPDGHCRNDGSPAEAARLSLVGARQVPAPHEVTVLAVCLHVPFVS
jgi:hypothetical protein